MTFKHQEKKSLTIIAMNYGIQPEANLRAHRTEGAEIKMEGIENLFSDHVAGTS